MREFAHRQQLRVSGVYGDPAALGAAVTVELCGHWEHDGPCRWPHHTSSTVEPDGTAEVTVRFDAEEADVAAVRERIVEALGAGALIGADGLETRWGPVRLAP